MAGHRMPTVLIVEDHSELRRELMISLRARWYDAVAARSQREALALVASRPPDALILDLGELGDGAEMIAELRRRYQSPIIVLSGRASLDSKLGAFDAGADDYVTKPFAMGELMARLRAALRRHESAVARSRPQRMIIGSWQVDLGSHQVTRAALAASEPDETPRLTPTEWAILELLLQRPGQLVRSAQLLTTVWGPGFQQCTNYLRFHMLRLRRKLEDNPSRPRHLLTEPRMGYRYVPAGSTAAERRLLTQQEN